VLRFKGGAKKRKAHEPARIPEVMGKVAGVGIDTAQITTMLSKEQINMDDLIAGLDLAQLVALDGLVDKYEKTLGGDTAIKCYSDFDTDLKQIQDTYSISLLMVSSITFDGFKCNF
jgi:hypothetical protein